MDNEVLNQGDKVKVHRSSRIAAGILGFALVTTACGARFPRPAAQAGGETTVGGTGQVVNPQTGEVTQVTPTTGPDATGSPEPGASPGSTSEPGTPSGTHPPSGNGGGLPSSAPTTSTGGPVDAGIKTGVSASTIKIAYLIPKSGAGQVPPQVDQGIRNYWEYLKTKGGIFGRNVTVDIIDTKSSESGARAAAQKALDDGNFIVAALDRLGVQGAIAKFLDPKGIPNVEVQVPVDLPQSMKWTFGISIDHRYQGTMIADYMSKVLKVKTVGYVRENDDTLKPGVSAFEAEAKRLGMKVVVADTIDASQSQFLSEASKIASAKPAACWLYMAPTPAASLATSTQNDGFHPTWFANSISWNFNIGLTAAPAAFQGAKAFSPWPSLNDPRAKFYRDNYSASGPPSLQDLGLPGWGLGQVIAAALKSAGKDLGRNSYRNAMQHLQLGSTSPVEGTPLLWSPLKFVEGQRQGGNSVVTYKTKGSGSNLAWTTETDYRTGY